MPEAAPRAAARRAWPLPSEKLSGFFQGLADPIRIGVMEPRSTGQRPRVKSAARLIWDPAGWHDLAVGP